MRSSVVAVVLVVLASGCWETRSPGIGAAGGEVASEGPSPAVLRFPPGALDEAAAITLKPVERRLPGAVGQAIEAGPHGLQFRKPVALRFPLGQGALPPGISFGELRVATLVDGKWKPLPTSFPAPGVIEGETTHFSTFALVAPCHVSGLGRSFALTQCPTFDARIETSADVQLEARGGPISLVLTFQPSGAAGPVDVEVSGLRAGWTYFLSRDGSYQPVALLADATGTVRFAQDVSAPHRLLLMAQHGSFVLTASSCPAIGTWNATTRTCTLNGNLTEPPLYVEESDVTVDCAGHVIGGTTRQSAGIYFFQRSNVSVRNCTIENVDLGLIGVGANLRLENVTVRTPEPLLAGAVAVDVASSAGVTIRGLTVDGYATGLGLSGASGVDAANLSLRVTGVPLMLESASASRFADVVLDGALSRGPELGQMVPPAGAPLPAGAVQLSNSRGIEFQRLTTTGEFGGVASLVAALFDSTVTVSESQLAYSRVAIRLDGPGDSVVTTSTLTRNLVALQLNGGTNSIFHNNFLENVAPAVAARLPAELSDVRPGSPTYQRGNFWGRACPGPLFVAGTDSNLAAVQDSFAYGVASAWRAGGQPGCVQPPALAPPVLTNPGEGAALREGTVRFEGTAVAGATVEVLEGGVVLASGLVSATGSFSVVGSTPLADGAHTVSARVRQGGLTSPPSGARSFVIDTQPPLAPVLDSPAQGAQLVEGAPFASGSAEPGARVNLRVDGVLIAQGTAAASGAFLLRVIGLAAGAHVLQATATDGAGNESAPSPAVSVTVVGEDSTLVGAAGSLEVSRVWDAPDAFESQAGEVNVVSVRGRFSSSGGAANAQYLLHLRRVVSALGGPVVATMEVSAPLASPQGSGSTNFERAVGWDGRDASGVLVAPGIYVSQVRLEVVRVSGGGGGCRSSSPLGCVLDGVDFRVTSEVASAPLLARPPALPAAQGVLTRAADVARVSSRVLVLPEAAFLAAMGSGGAGEASLGAKQAAVKLAGAIRDPAVLGAVGELSLSSAPTSYAGELFLVTRSAGSAQPSAVESTDFYVAAVRLSGKSPWVGSLQTLATSTVRTAPSENCCSAQPLCTSETPLPKPCGTTGYCPPPDTRVEEGSSSVGDRKLTIVGSAGLSMDFGCTGAVYPLCTQAQPYCGPTSTKPLPPGSGGSQSYNGGCTTSDTGRSLPPVCTVVLTEGELPEDCGGYCTSCGQLASTWWLRDGVHPSCAFSTAAPGEEVCRPQSAAEQTIANLQAYQRVKDSGCDRLSRDDGSCCGPSCVCEAGPGALNANGASIKACARCDGQDNCQTFVQPSRGVELIARVRGVDECNPRPNPGPRATPAASSVPTPPSAPKPPSTPATKPPPQSGASAGAAPSPTPDSPAPGSPKPADNQPPTDTNPPTDPPAPPPPPPPPPEDPFQQAAQEAFADNRGRADELVRPETAPGVKDPVRIGDGRLEIRQVDVSMPGPAKPLEFARIYDSGSADRSPLGSNWAHNWDFRLQLIREGNRPSWLPLYCASTPKQDMCVVLHDRFNGTRLFALDLGTGLYMPQAGSTDTLARTRRGGWALRSRHGDVTEFNAEGYPTQMQDRFGNGFAIEQEDTPLGALFRHGCKSAVPLSASDPLWRRCAVLAALLDEGAFPQYPSPAWDVSAADFSFAVDAPTEAYYGLAEFLHALSLGNGSEVHSRYGARRMRPRRVVDDSGRALDFTYKQAPALDAQRWDFAGTVAAGLLTQVRGPAGVEITFTYQEPPSHPAALAERFLTLVSRVDTPASGPRAPLPAPPRTQAFEYQWPGGPTTTWSDYEASVYERYFEYFRKFVGCWQRELLTCGSSTADSSRFTQTPGSPARLARLAKQEYISQVADNIIQVTQTGTIESETRHQADPFALDFDRALAQRAGSSERLQDTSRLPRDVAQANWATTLPRVAFAHQPAGPAASGGDLTEAFLPAQLLARYPLEAAPAAGAPAAKTPAAPKASGASPGLLCDAAAAEQARKLLPGHQETLDYFGIAELSLDSGLRRTPLTCEQLAVAQTSDASHNDLLSELVPLAPLPGAPKSPTLYEARAVTHRRGRIAANVNRICGWTRYTDADGDTRYFGTNYKGQILVEAVQPRGRTGDFVVTESLYTADGQLRQARRPTAGAQPWTPLAGHVVYEYDEVDPSGNSGWNRWLPGFWTRRENLVSVIEYAAQGGVQDVAESTGPTQVSTSQYRFKSLRYEPLFNQLLTTQEGSGTGSQRTVHRRTDTIPDYMELSFLEAVPLLEHLETWGYRWLRRAGQLDKDALLAWQLPLPFLEQDLNGDDMLGSPAVEPARRGVGLPVASAERRGDVKEAYLARRMVWNATGQPLLIQSSEGQAVLFDYHPVDSFGGASAPAPGTRLDGSGLLARVESMRFRDDYPASRGPAEAPCPLLSGPYQWLLPSSCSNAEDELEALGLPDEAILAILESRNTASTSRREVVSFAYNETGHAVTEWRDTGTVTRTRDVDGRILTETDVVGTVTRNGYDARARLTSSSRTGADGRLVEAHVFGLDEEGLRTCECRELTPGACGAVCPTDAPPGASVIRTRYTAEGHIAAVTDPEGAVTEYTLDEWKRARRVRRAGGGEERVDEQDYSLDGDPTHSRRGVSPTAPAGLLRESMEYDGLRRLARYTDTRGVLWQVGHSSRDLLSFIARSDSAPTTGSTGEWTVRFVHDDAGNLLSRVDNDVVTTTTRRAATGEAFATEKTGEGSSFATYDTSGRQLWSRDAAGTMRIATSRPAPHQATLTTVRSEAGRRLTTAEVVALDAAGRVVSRAEGGGWLRRLTEYARNGDGEVVHVRNAEGFLTDYTRNLAGWAVTVEEQASKTSTSTVEKTTYTHDRRGLVVGVQDANLRATSLAYNAFGEVRTRSVPGVSPLVFDYDAVGRTKRRLSPLASVRYDFDERGDPVREVLEGATEQTLVQRRFDGLGRLAEITNFNLEAPASLGSQRVVTTVLAYDSLGRLERQAQQLGAGVPRVVTSEWALNGAGRWQREVSLPGRGTTWLERYDGAGRRVRDERLAGSVAQVTDFEWLGELAVARSHTKGTASPFREARAFDSFGATRRWDYTAVDVAGGQPVDAAEGAAYCGGTWDAAACGEPLYAAEVVRDVMGRVGSLQWKWSNPAATTTQARAKPWRGYGYSAQGRLAVELEDEGVGTSIATTEFVAPVTEEQVRLVGAGSQRWGYEREAVGGTLAVREEATSAVRWRTTAPREDYQLRGVEVGGVSRQVAHDAEGRVVRDGARTHRFGARGELLEVLQGGASLEAYTYDGLGRLVGVYGGATARTVLTYDGSQAVQGADGSGAVQWEARWGPGQDELLEWEDIVGGTGRHLAVRDSRGGVVGYWSVAAAALSETVTYTAQGQVVRRNSSGAVVCSEETGATCALPTGSPFGFSAAWRSEATGLVAMRARWYSPALGEFLSQDPAGYVDSFNLYAYAGFDPINRWDPSGRTVEDYERELTLLKTDEARRVLRDLHAKKDMTFTVVRDVPSGASGPDAWGEIDTSRAMSERSIRIVINEAKLRAATEAEATWDELIAHEGTHALRWRPAHNEMQRNPRTGQLEQTPEAVRLIHEEEGPAYASSLKAREELNVVTDDRWLKAHPAVEHHPTNLFASAPAQKHPRVAEAVRQIRGIQGRIIEPTRIQKKWYGPEPGPVRPRDQGPSAKSPQHGKGLAE